MSLSLMFLFRMVDFEGSTVANPKKVKPNVGHSEGASGITSIIKCVLALEKNIVPPNVHFHTPNPKSGCCMSFSGQFFDLLTDWFPNI